ncbi:MAG: alginate O-acetyltransferase complex protein AlgI [Planctomycetota bacterium]|jgi:alginate O-acetyltransferase complex protein AlgI
MNFNSPEFLLFFPLVLLSFWAVFKHERGRDVVLLLASYAFYMSWNWRYAGLIAFSTLIDFAIGRKLAASDKQSTRKALLLGSLTINLGLLALFKYYNFFVDLARESFSLIGTEIEIPHHELLLPVGISFYTFQTLSYTLDIYRRELKPEGNLLKFALFVSFFPQLVAGPIVRASTFLPQLHKRPRVDAERMRYGLWRIFRGLFKKVIIADLLANFAIDGVFADPTAFSSWDVLLALYAYSFQIYNDFSGYSDVAIGAACMLGFDIPMNFNRPYLSRNVREFWTRWHISLSSWLRDYLYIPLGGNHGTKSRVKFNLSMTMLLGGLWHGAALNFVFWGAYHGLLLIFARATDRRPTKASLGRIVRERLVCFHLVLFGWLLFRVTSWQNLVEFGQAVFAFEGGTSLHPFFFAVLGLAIACHCISQRWVESIGERVRALPVIIQGGLYAGMILLFSAATIESPAFIYFQF